MNRNATNIVVLLLIAGLFVMCNYDCLFTKSAEEIHQARIDGFRRKLATGDIETRRKLLNKYAWGHNNRELPEETIVPIFLEVLQENDADEIRAMAALALAYYPGHPDVIPALEAGFADTVPGVKFTCATALILATQDTERLLPVVLELVPDNSIDPKLLLMGLWSLPGFLDRGDWDSLTTVLLAELEAAPEDRRFDLASMLYGLGIYDERYVPDILARLDLRNRGLVEGAVRMLGTMGETGKSAIPVLLDFWAGPTSDEWYHDGITEEIARFGPLLAPHLDRLIEFGRTGQYPEDLLVLISAIGPEAEPAIPMLLEMYESTDFRYRNGVDGIHEEIINTLGCIGTPAAAEASVPLLLDYCRYLEANGKQVNTAPLINFGKFGDDSAEITNLLHDALVQSAKWTSKPAAVAAVQLSPDDEELVEILRSQWVADPHGNGFNHDQAEALACSGNLDLVLPFLERCFTGDEGLMEYLPVVEICTNLGPAAAPAVSTITKSLEWEYTREHPGCSIRTSTTIRGNNDVLLHYECLRAIGPAAADALPLLQDLRESARPCDVEYIDEVIGEITPVE